MATIMGNVIFCSLLPIAIPTSKAFGLETVFYVNLAITINLFNAAPMTLISVWVYSRFSTSGVLRCVVTLQVAGAACRALCFFTESFWPVAIGSYLCSCCNPFFLNVMTIIANRWFTDNERALATALLIIGSPIGVGVSYGLTGYWFIGIKDQREDPKEFLELLKTLMVT